MKSFYNTLLLLLFINGLIYAQTPEVKIQTINADAGIVYTPVYMVGFTDTVNSITLRIYKPGNQLEFLGIENISGFNINNWVTNEKNNTIYISWFDAGAGYKPNGQVFDLKFNYQNTNNADLIFLNEYCNITYDINTVENVVYINGKVISNNNLQVPNIVALPLKFSDTLRKNENSVQNLKIKNTGKALLNYSLQVKYDNANVFPNLQWLQLNMQSGSIEENIENDVSVTINTTELEVGDHKATINIAHNVPNLDTIKIPVNVKVLRSSCDPPKNLDYHITENNGFIVNLYWEKPTYTDDILGYNIYRNNELFVSNHKKLEYSYKENIGEYDFYIKAVYSYCNESDSSNNVKIKIVDVEELEFLKINIYPNPANKILFINGIESVLKIEIINEKGKLLESIENKSTLCELDVNKYSSGIYFIKLTSNNKKSKTFKVLIN